MSTCNLRWMDNNFIDLDAFDAGNITASSALSSFPARNFANTARSKIWRPAGNFEVTTSNQNIYINDGTDKTAVLTVGSYTPASLATEIQTQLNAVSANWTCSYDLSTEYKFTISNTGSVTLRFATTTNAAWDMLGYTLTSNQTSTSFKAQEQRNHTAEWYKLDASASVTFDTFMVISPIDEVFPLSTNATIKLQANNVDVWTSPPLDRTITRLDNGLYDFFDDDLTETLRTYRYWRFYYEDRLNPKGPEGVSFGHVYMGDYLTTNTNVASGFTKPTVDPSRASESESGARFFEERTKYTLLNGMAYQVIAEDDRLALEGLYSEFGRTRPLFVSVDPKLEISPNLGNLTYYVNFNADPTPQSLFRDKYSYTLSLREAV